MKQRVIGVFFDAPNYGDYPFNHEEYVTAYRELAELIEEQGGRFAIVRQQTTYAGANRFSRHWLFEDGAFVEHDEPIDLDLIYDKGHFVGDASSTLLNDPALDTLCTDKRVTAARFKEFSPRTITVKDEAALRQALDTWDGDTVVAKPVDGQEGKGVVIGTKEEVLAAPHAFPLLVQQYVDASGGIPGICDGPHDYRTIVINGETALTYVRTAPKGSLIANVSQGGKEIEVLPEHRPAEASAVVAAIDAEIAEEFPHRTYSIDLARDASGRWYIIELNAKPGLSKRSQGKTYPRYLELLAQALVARSSRP